MPLDPIIANPAKFDSGDRLADFNNYLLASSRMSEAAKARQAEQVRNALNDAYQQFTDKDGKVNVNALVYHLSQNHLGTAIPGVRDEEQKLLKGASEIDKTKAETGKVGAETTKLGAETGKVNAEAFKQAWENHQKELTGISTDPKVGHQQLVDWTLRAFKDPILGPAMLAHGDTPEKAVAQLEASLKSMPYDQFLLTNQIGAEKASENHITTEDLGDTSRVTSTKVYGTPHQTTLSNSKIHESPDAKYKGTHVNVQVPVSTQVMTSAGKKFGEVVEEEQGKEFASLDHLNSQAPAELANVDQTLKMLQSGNVITGFGADQQAALLSMAKAMHIPVNNEMLKNTQMLRQQIGRNLMGRIASYKAQGISLTPMSNLDLENFQRTGPQIFDDPATLIESFKNYRQTIVDGVNRYNQLKNTKMTSPVVGETVKKVYQPQPAAAIPPAPGHKKPLSPEAQRYLAKHNHK
jgi:hypothetical protein